jgi:5-(hydroxymethyl)furfural/furfural oxidase
VLASRLTERSANSVMGMIALRGTPADYDAWERAGAEGWGWTHVLPYFCRLESDWNFKGDLHGDAGPLPIRRVDRTEWPPLAHAVERWARSRGMPFIADMNADFRDGYGALPISNTLQSRACSAFCYLGAEVRRRGNLAIATSATVTRIMFEGSRATGVSARVGGEEREFRAREIILTAGAIFSPALLMRSGIGAAAELRGLCIPVVANLPGVGANLQNHPVLFIGLHFRREARQAAALRTVPAVALRYSSGMAGCPPHDLYVNVQNRTSWNALGRQVGNIAPTLLRPASQGQVSLVSPDPLVPPRVEFNFLDEDVDLRRLTQAFALAVQMICGEELRALSRRAFPVRFGDRIRQLNERNAVVDPEGCVHGIAGLRVADASIMPNVIAGNTNIPTIMVAEKIAAAIGSA